MGLSELLATMEREAQAQASSIRQAARQEAERIVREAKERAATRQSMTVGSEQDRMREESNRRIALEQRRARGELLRLREDLLGRVRALARERLPALTEQEAYRGLLPGLMESSLGYAGGDGVRVNAAPQLVAVLAALDGRRIPVTADPGILAGFMVLNAAGTRQVDQRLEQRLDALWPRIAIELCRQMGTAL